MTDIQCTFSSSGTGLRDSVTALLRKPEGFRGAPLFADDRATDPVSDPVCQIKPETDDPTGLLYRLKITDFTKCGVLKRNVSERRKTLSNCLMSVCSYPLFHISFSVMLFTPNLVNYIITSHLTLKQFRTINVSVDRTHHYIVNISLCLIMTVWSLRNSCLVERTLVNNQTVVSFLIIILKRWYFVIDV